MNKNLMMVIDNQMNPGKYTKEQLRQNASEAATIYSNADAAEYVAFAADYAASDYAADYVADYVAIEHWVDQYFLETEEDKQDYIDAINKGDK